MSRCPKCKSPMPFFKIGFLTKQNDGLECNVCKTYSRVKPGRLSFLGSTGALIGMVLVNNTYRNFQNAEKYWFLGIIYLIFLMGIIMIIQYNTTRLYISKKPFDYDKPLLKKEPYPKDIPNKLKYPKEHLKYIYWNYSKTQLEEIISGGGYRIEAKNAARELLKEKYNT